MPPTPPIEHPPRMTQVVEDHPQQAAARSGAPDREDALAAAAVAVRRYLRFLGCDWALAEDLAQEAILESLRVFDHGAPPVPWLLTAARNGYRMHLRRRGRRREVPDLDALHRQWIEVAGSDSGAMRLAALRACLAALPPRARRALELRYGEVAKRPAIARELGLGREGVKSLLARLRAALAACVQRRLNDG
jgi:RNA polymerase sigma-70 factor (ECF subfamily)